MTRFSIRGVIYVLVVILGLLSAAPNILPSSLKTHLPQWYTQTTLSLGLDLQGGSHLLLEADTNSLFAKQLESYSDILLQTLREEGVRYTKHTNHHQQQVNLSLRNPEDAAQVKALAIEISSQGDGTHALTVDASGANIVLSLDKAYRKALEKDAINRAVEVVRNRLDETGLTEPNVSRQGNTAILVQMPGMSDPSQVKALLGTTAQMRFHWQANSQTQQRIFRIDSHDRQYELDARVALEGEHITDASAAFSAETGQPVVTFRLDNEGARQFAAMTQKNVGRVLAVVLDDTVVTAPVINGVIPGGRGEIVGSFTMSEAQDVALMLRTGALPVPLTIVEERSVGPDLGSDAIQSGVISGLVGGLAVLAFMVGIYGRWGVIASVALSVNMALVFGVLTLLGATLTLPGIAGLILTMGMAVDANILINERIREETKGGRPAGSALSSGFNSAISTIVDSNMTTLIAVSLLFMFGSGPVKGFAVTIAIGLITSLFTSVALTKMIMQWVTRKSTREPLRFTAPLLMLADKRPTLHVLKRWKLALIVSVILTSASVGLFYKPGLNYGVDFTGGTIIELEAPGLSTDALRSVLSSQGLHKVTLQEYDEPGHYLLRAPAEVQNGVGGSQVKNIKQVISHADKDVVFHKVDMVGPKVSNGFAELSVLALLIAGTGMLVYLWVRYEAHFASAALFTVVLDLTKTIGFFALTGIEFNLTAVAALLALIGYSINDKVVVLDRVRELIRRDSKRKLNLVIDEAVNTTLSRTVFTSLTTLLALFPMAIWGGEAVRSFALPMVFAVIIGTSSTLFITSALLYLLGKRRERQGKAQLRPTHEEVKASLAHIP
jgi:SecD/SecF fusion protein